MYYIKTIIYVTYSRITTIILQSCILHYITPNFVENSANVITCTYTLFIIRTCSHTVI